MKNLYFAILLVCGLLLTACSSMDKDPADLYKGQSAKQIFNDGENDLLKERYDDAEKHFEAIDARYPFSEYTQQSHLDLIYAYYMQGDTASAVASADRYIRLYPRGPHVDYAYYMRGLVTFEENRGAFERWLSIDFSKRDLTILHNSFQDFNQLIQFFPESPYAPDARKKMIHIRNLFARHQLQTAQFYYERKTYVAAINRANEVILHYQETPSVPDALAVIVKSYRALGYQQEADKTLQLLRLNFPQSKAFKDVL